MYPLVVAGAVDVYVETKTRDELKQYHPVSLGNRILVPRNDGLTGGKAQKEETTTPLGMAPAVGMGALPGTERHPQPKTTKWKNNFLYPLWPATSPSELVNFKASGCNLVSVVLC
jgi:hypothetical protein